MKRFKKVISVSLVLVMVLSLVTACGDKKSGGTDRGKDGFNLTVTIASEPETIDPSLNSAMDAADYILHTFEGLMKFEPSGDGEVKDTKVVEGQAESYEISEDQCTYTFHLRDNIKWSDGKKVKADDFVYAWRRLVNPKTASDYQSFINCVENAEAIVAGEKDYTELGIEATDDKTVVIKLVAPCAYFLDLVAGAQLVPLREDIVDGNDSWTFEPDTYVSNGPFKMKEWNHDESLILEKNDNYYDKDAVTVDQLTFMLMADSNAILAGFQGGTLDMINQVPVDETTTMLADGSLKTLPMLGTYCAVFNVEKAPFDNPKVREAFSLAIDRNYICEKVTQTGEAPATGWVPAGIKSKDASGNDSDFRADGGDYYSVKPDDYAANCEKAKELLAEAGYPEGKGFPVVEYLYNTLDSHQKIYEALENMWSTVLGVTVTGSNQDWNVFLSTREAGEFQLARHGWIADFNDAMNFLDMFTTSSIDGNNYARWSNPDYDKAISAANVEVDPAKRATILHDAEDLMMKDSIVAPLYFYQDKYSLKEGLSGMYHTSLGYFFFKYVTNK
ncbi:MAG: peptide ABC transporter substrate-binding protein [Lachnospiraceae bacterium]